MKNQRSATYQNEYDKIKSILDHVITPKGPTPHIMKIELNILKIWAHMHLMKKLNLDILILLFLIKGVFLTCEMRKCVNWLNNIKLL
jgi:hypothetical protein